MVGSMGKKECLLSNILASAFRKRGSKKGKPERSAGFVVVLFFGVFGWIRGRDPTSFF
jgi:hypothetical protein